MITLAVAPQARREQDAAVHEQERQQAEARLQAAEQQRALEQAQMQQAEQARDSSMRGCDKDVGSLR